MKFVSLPLFATMVACVQADHDNLGNLAPKENLPKSIDTDLLGAADNQAHHDNRRLHGTEVQHCFTAVGDLRIFVAHWHHGEGATTSEGGIASTAGTMTIQEKHLEGQPSNTMSVTGSVDNAIAGSLPGCVGSSTQASTCSDVSNPFNDWVWFDFPITCNVPFDYTLLSGDIYLTAACAELYPAVISGNVACITNQPSLSPSSSPSSSPTSSPSLSPTALPTDKPSLSPTTSPSDKPSRSPTTSPSDKPSPSPTVVQSLGGEVCQNFAVHGRTAVTFSAIQTTITGGDVGIAPATGAAITGLVRIVDGVRLPGATAQEQEFAAHATIAFQEAMAVRSDGNTLVTAPIGGKTFTPGTYRSAATISIAAGGIVTLDGLDQANPVFIFQATSTLGTGAGSYFNLINGAKAENVLWAIGTAATLGANTVLPGSILAGTAITIGAQALVQGCVVAQTAITFSSEGYLVMPGSQVSARRTRQLRVRE
jgi:hypothetical protein